MTARPSSRPTGEAAGEVSGRFRHRARGPADYPAVGDWAAVRPAGDDLVVIEALLPRRSAFTRKAAGEAVEAQVVAANVDTVFLVSGLDGDFNVRRIERYLTTAWSSGAEPVIVLNKADLRPDLPDVIAETAGVAPGVPIVAVRALADGGLEGLAPYLREGRTVALLGSSGVGKSTMINRLLGEDRFATASMSDAAAGRGRHTTTARELVRLPGGALLVDTPGMRELGLWADDEGLDRTFDEIESLAARCRFPDCGHEHEPGCAVRAAVEDGTIDRRRWESYLKLRRELASWSSRRTRRPAGSARKPPDATSPPGSRKSKRTSRGTASSSGTCPFGTCPRLNPFLRIDGPASMRLSCDRSISVTDQGG